MFDRAPVNGVVCEEVATEPHGLVGDIEVLSQEVDEDAD